VRKYDEEVKRLKEELGMVEQKSVIRNEEKDVELKDVLHNSDDGRLTVERDVDVRLQRKLDVDLKDKAKLESNMASSNSEIYVEKIIAAEELSKMRMKFGAILTTL
jgi:hypothetical protein